MVSRKDMLKGFVIVNTFVIVGLALLMYTAVAAEGGEAAIDASVSTMSLGYGVSKAGVAIAAGLAVGIAAFGAGLGVGIIGSAALGAIAEKKEMGSWSFIFIALAEGVAFYGLIISFMLIGKL